MQLEGDSGNLLQLVDSLSVQIRDFLLIIKVDQRRIPGIIRA